MQCQQAVQAPVIFLLRPESTQAMVQDVLSADVIGVKKALKTNIQFLRFFCFAQAFRPVWQVLHSETVGSFSFIVH